MSGYIDLVANLYTPAEVADGLGTIDDNFKAQVRMDPEIWNGLPIPKYIEKKGQGWNRKNFLSRGANG